MLGQGFWFQIRLTCSPGVRGGGWQGIWGTLGQWCLSGWNRGHPGPPPPSVGPPPPVPARHAPER